MRRFAAAAIGEIRPGDEAVVPALTAALQDSDRDVRAAAKEALGRLKK